LGNGNYWLINGGAGMTVEAAVPGVTGQAIGWASHGWWTGCVVDYMFKGSHDKPLGVGNGDDVQPAKCRSEPMYRPVSSSCDEGVCKTAGVCWKITYVIYDYVEQV
jgi:hypothetical protein